MKKLIISLLVAIVVVLSMFAFRPANEVGERDYNVVLVDYLNRETIIAYSDGRTEVLSMTKGKGLSEELALDIVMAFKKASAGGYQLKASGHQEFYIFEK